MKKSIVIILLVFYSCSVSNEELIGVYVEKNKFITDSLVLLEDKSYKRIIRSTKEDKLLYSQINTWSYSEETLELKNFLNKTGTGFYMIKSKDSNFRMPIISTNFTPNKNLFNNVVFDIDRYNYFIKN